MALRTLKTAIAGLLGLTQFPSNFQPSGIGAPTLTEDEKAIVEAVNSIVAAIEGTPGAPANFTYTVATLAARPAVASVPDGTLVFVQSQRSWYRSDLVGNTYRREPLADASWQSVTAWSIDPAGSAEASGAPGFPIPWEEFVQRLPVPTVNMTITFVAGAVQPSLIWQPESLPSTARIDITLTAVRTLGTPAVVASSSDETTTLAPRVDAGVALTVGGLVQVVTGATAGATACVTALVTGTNYETSPWRTAGAARAVPPTAGDTIAIVTNATAAFVGIATRGNIRVTVSNFAISALGGSRDTSGDRQSFAACTFVGAFAGAISTGGVSFSVFSGCAFGNGATFNTQSFLEYCGFVQTVANSEAAFNAGAGQCTMNDCVCDGRGIVVRDGSYLNINRVGVMNSTQYALDAIRGGTVRIGGTFYGSLNAQGTLVDDAGICLVDSAVTPTCAATANQLLVDGEANPTPRSARVSSCRPPARAARGPSSKRLRSPET